MKKRIFVTAGTQLAFDRLLKWMNNWGSLNDDSYILAQACDIKGRYDHLETVGLMSPQDYSQAITSSSLLVGHAGIGTIITAHEQNLPLIIVPREYSLGEHRNDHQIATAEKFKNIKGLYVARNEQELHELLNKKDLEYCSSEQSTNRQSFISSLKNTIDALL